ncbi:hypothetical protein GCM10017559_07950 [Streptosporangium longisporum]|uniref:Uncharacterized protein n=1 Tax=Streptosporangium longisporum TaxID=46187 RepID=A0ABN3XRI4_9ACTN
MSTDPTMPAPVANVSDLSPEQLQKVTGEIITHLQAPDTVDRLAEIRAALDAVPAPPWQWIGDRRTRVMLTTTHSGWQYVLGVGRPLDSDGEQAENLDGSPIWADLEFRHQADGAKYATLTPARELAVGRTDYDPDTIRDIDNPVARWMRDSAQYVTELLAEVDRLAEERDQAIAHDRQPYPTQWAYDHACEALEKHRQRADNAEAERDGLRHALKRAALSLEHDPASRNCQERNMPIHDEDCPACDAQAALQAEPAREADRG